MMVEVNLDRFLETGLATLGRLRFPAGAVYTLEDPWADNARGRSCIPEGRYKLARDTFKDRYPNFRLVDVPGRTAIEIHRGNTVNDTEGCILVGQRVVLFEDGMPVLQDSATAMNRFMRAMTPFADDVELVVRGGGTL